MPICVYYYKLTKRIILPLKWFSPSSRQLPEELVEAFSLKGFEKKPADYMLKNYSKGDSPIYKFFKEV